MMFTPQELNDIVEKRLSRERRKLERSFETHLGVLRDRLAAAQAEHEMEVTRLRADIERLRGPSMSNSIRAWFAR